MSNPDKINILFVSLHDKRWVSLEWLCQYLPGDKLSVSFAVLNQGGSLLVPYLRATGVPVFEIGYAGRLKLLRAAMAIARYCRDHDIDIVHAHFESACLPALLGALLAGVKVRIYTRHYADPASATPQKRQRKAYWINTLATAVVAPSLAVKKFLIDTDAVPGDKVRLIHHGFDLEKFTGVPAHEIAAIRKKYGIGKGGPVVGVVSRYSFIKGIQYIIPAFRQLLDTHPDAQLVLAGMGVEGEYHDQIKGQLLTLPATSIVEIPFEENVFALFQTFDAFVHVPIGPQFEAFGQVFVEALAAGIPSVFTRSGITCEVMVHREHAWLVDHRDSAAIHRGLCALIDDATLRQTLIENGKRLAFRHFSVAEMIGALERLYVEEVSASQG